MTAPVQPKARADLAVVELDGEAVIYDERDGSLHHLNPSATLVFSLCDGSSSTQQIAADISESFGVAAEEVEAQLRGLLRQFRRAGLLERAEGAGA